MNKVILRLLCSFWYKLCIQYLTMAILLSSPLIFVANMIKDRITYFPRSWRKNGFGGNVIYMQYIHLMRKKTFNYVFSSWHQIFIEKQRESKSCV